MHTSSGLTTLNRTAALQQYSVKTRDSKEQIKQLSLIRHPAAPFCCLCTTQHSSPDRRFHRALPNAEARHSCSKPQATTCRTSTSLTVALERPVGEGFAESDLHRRPRPVSPAPWHRGRGFLVLRNIGSDLCCPVGSARGRENTHRGVPKKEKVCAGLADPVPMAGRLGSTFQRGGIANTLVNRTSPARGFCTATEGDQTLCQAQKQTSNLNEVLSEDKLSGTVAGLVRQLPSVSAAPILDDGSPAWEISRAHPLAAHEAQRAPSKYQDLA